MNTQTSELRSFPPVEDFVAFVASIDWVSVYNNIITVAAYVAAITVVLGTKLLNAIVRFWEVNGNDIKAKANRTVDYAYMAAAVTYNTGKNVGERYYSFRDLIRSAAN